MVTFYPVYENEQDEYYIKKEYSDTFQQNLLQVLTYYGVSHQVSDGQVLIDQEEYENKELMRNYTKKAEDTAWLQNHQN